MMIIAHAGDFNFCWAARKLLAPNIREKYCSAKHRALVNELESKQSVALFRAGSGQERAILFAPAFAEYTRARVIAFFEASQIGPP